MFLEDEDEDEEDKEDKEEEGVARAVVVVWIPSLSREREREKKMPPGKRKTPVAAAAQKLRQKVIMEEEEEEEEEEDIALGPLDDDDVNNDDNGAGAHAALQRWSSDVVDRLGVSVSDVGLEEFDAQLETLFANASNNNEGNNALGLKKGGSSSLSKSQSSNNNAEEEEEEDPIKSGDLAHLGFPFDGEFGKNELKESLREAFRERTDTGKGQGKRKGEPMKEKKTKKKTKTTERRNPGGDVASIDDAWAKITDGNKIRNDDDDDAEKTVRGNAKSNAKNGNALGDATMGGAMTERKNSSSNIDPRRTITSSLFTAQKSLQDLVRVLGLTNAANAPSVEQMAHEASPMTSYNIAEIAKMMSTFVGSGNGSNGNNDAVDGHTKRANNQKETDEEKGNKNVPKKKRRVSKTNVPRVEIDNDQIVELTKEDINLIVTPGGIKPALPPRKKGRRAHNFTDAETEEEKKRRREERVYKNRQSAARSRARKLKTIGELQEEISRLTCENDALRELCKSSGVTEATMTTKLGETEAQRQKEKKEVEERDAKKVTKSPGSSKK